MHVTFTPEDGDRHEWTFKPGRVRASEAQIIEKQFGGNWEEFALGVQSGNIKARRVMLWHLIRRDHPMLAFSDTPDFYADELVVEFSTDELAPMRDRIAKASMPEDERDRVLSALDLSMSEAMEREAASGQGKAPSETPSTDGGLSSPLS